MKLHPITRANRPDRKQVLLGEEEAAALIKDGDVVIVGGFGTVNHPMPIIRALVRRNVKSLTVIGAATAGLEIDLLIGAGCVRKVIAPYIGAELHAPIGHCYRRAAENDEIEVYETSEYHGEAASGLRFQISTPITFPSTIRSMANPI
jgi:glutaconate CoA-transferase subunit A